MLSPKEVGLNWIDHGYEVSEAILARGVSAEEVNYSLKSGYIRWSCPNPNMLAYQKEILSNGGYLYYSLPFIDSLSSCQPEISQKIKELNKTTLNDLTIDRVLDKVGYYAFQSAIEDCLYNKIGVRREDNEWLLAAVRFLSLRDYPKSDYLAQQIRYAHILQSYGLVGSYDAEKDLLAMKQAQRKSLLKTALRRRGVILLFNKDVLSRGRLLTNQEDILDVMIHSDEPLPLSVVSGVLPLSSSDEEVMLENL